MSAPFVRADAPNKRGLRVTYYRADGSAETRVGGYRTWRNQNPGNISAKGTFTKDHGAIGKAGGFAVFPSYETGRAAIFSLLGIPKYQERTIAQTIEAYAPAKGGNNTERYKRLFHKWTGLDLKRKIKDLTEKEMKSLVDAIEKMEGYQAGKIIDNPAKKKISAVRKDDKGTIVSYYIDGLGWIAKTRAIELASDGKIDAVVAVSRAGNTYLRTRPDQAAENNLEAMG